jgi:hypothetical protein
LQLDPELKAVVTIAMNEGISVQEVYKRGALDLSLRIARLSMTGDN